MIHIVDRDTLKLSKMTLRRFMVHGRRAHTGRMLLLGLIWWFSSFNSSVPNVAAELDENEKSLISKFIDSTPKECWHNEIFVDCMSICEDREEILLCYAQVDESLDIKEKRRLWAHCSFTLGDHKNDIFDYPCNFKCISDPEKELCLADCEEVREPSISVFGCEGAEAEQCRFDIMKEECKIILGTTPGQSSPQNQSLAKAKTVAEEHSLVECVESSEYNYTNCLNDNDEKNKSQCYLYLREDYHLNYCFEQCDELNEEAEPATYENIKDHVTAYFTCHENCSKSIMKFLCKEFCFERHEADQVSDECTPNRHSADFHFCHTRDANTKYKVTIPKGPKRPFPIDVTKPFVHSYFALVNSEEDAKNCSGECQTLSPKDRDICLHNCTVKWESYKDCIEKYCRDIPTECIPKCNQRFEKKCREICKQVDCGPQDRNHSKLIKLSADKCDEICGNAFSGNSRMAEAIENPFGDDPRPLYANAKFSPNYYDILCNIRVYTSHMEDLNLIVRKDERELMKLLRCPEIISTKVSQLTNYASCKWKVDFSQTKSPFKLWTHYFNEIKPWDAQDKLQKPNTKKFLQSTSKDDGKGYFVFPYFFIVRGLCESESFNDDDFNSFILRGSVPTITVQYFVVDNRLPIRSALKVKYDTVLINLNVSQNNDILAKDGQICLKNICHPAYAAPMPFLHVPILSIVQVPAEDVFEELRITVYNSPYHSRDHEGKGRVQMERRDNRGVSAHLLFPKRDTEKDFDVENPDLKTCFNIKDKTTKAISSSPYASNCPTISLEEHLPLTTDDFFAPQFTFRTAPVTVFAGFFRPNLLVIGDPDMKDFTLFEWGEDRKNYEGKNNIFSDEGNACVFGRKGRSMPLYSWTDLSDEQFPLNYHRFGYTNLDYVNGSKSRAIFEVISLEDRLLLVTTGGLVTLYGSTHSTVQTNRLWSAPEEEKIYECFKFVRAPLVGMPNADVIVGVSYNRQEENGKEKVFMGKLVKAGVPMEWAEIQSSTTNDTELSEVEKICQNVITTKMANKVKKYPSKEWCIAVDGSPIPSKESTIQLLIRMAVKYTDDKGKAVIASASGVNNTAIYFYILASYTSVDASVAGSWNIDSIIPRTPCIGLHKESVRLVVPFAKNYWRMEDDSDIDGVKSCNPRKKSKEDVDVSKDKLLDFYLTRMTYTRSLAGHMFLYGNTLLHSSDEGKSFVLMRDFPQEEYIDYKLNTHRIAVMAFDKSGHFAFLTNRRELWYGSVGDLRQYRLRPNPAYSATETFLSNVDGLMTFPPFAVMFDSSDKLFEMVVTVKKGRAEKIVKRPVLVTEIFQNMHFLHMLEGDRVAFKNGTKNYRYNERKFDLFCSFSTVDVVLDLPFKGARRNQIFNLGPPLQHPDLGASYSMESLLAFQAASFGPLYQNLYNTPKNTYSRFYKDPATTWKAAKHSTAHVGLLNWLIGNSSKHGIVINPVTSAQRDLSDRRAKFSNYVHLDYGQVANYTIDVSIKNEGSLALPNYKTRQVSRVQLNVDNANATLLQIYTERILLPSQASVRFNISLQLVPSRGLPQQYPGHNLVQIPAGFHFIGAFGKCFPTADKSVSDSVGFIILAGCYQATKLTFNWNSTLNSIKFRDKTAQYGQSDGCYNKERACFYSRQSLKLHFDIFNIADQSYRPFKGKFTMRVIAGGYDKNNMIPYTEEEEEAYNIPGVSDVSLIWTEWDEESHSKVKSQGDSNNNLPSSTKQVVLTSGKSAIKWACHTLSPCARISPTIYGETVYWFRIAVSNRGVDKSTLCLYEMEFDILLYGFTPSPEIQLFVTIIFCLLIFLVLYLLYYCCRSHKKVWRANKLKLQGWMQILSDTFPKPLKDLTTTANKEEHAIRKGYIIGSIQGHLTIPKMYDGTNEEEVGEPGTDGQEKEGIKNAPVSSMSIKSTDTSSIVLPAVNPRNGAGTWTDLVYEQIITKRLQAIVEKNKEMRDGILKKVDLSRLKDSVEHEERMQNQHGEKAGTEPGYIPPFDKKPKGSQK